MDSLELAFLMIGGLTLLVGVLSAATYGAIAANADERKLRSLDRVGRGLIAAARVCAIVALVLTATTIIMT